MAVPPESNERAAERCRVRIRLTDSALRRVNAADLSRTLGTLRLNSNTQVGDLVVLDAAGGRERFAVFRRAWVQEADGMVLEITLDWPARG